VTPAQQSLKIAFNELVMELHYKKIHVPDIVRRADVSRSTFYEHFKSKEHLLKDCLTPVLKPIAEVSCGITPPSSLVPILEHFIEIRTLAAHYFRSPMLETVAQLLSDIIQEKMLSSESKSDQIPATLLAKQRASSCLGLITAWLEAPSVASAEQIAEHISNNSVV